MTIEIISIIFNVLLGGSLIVTLVTLKSTKRKANANAVEADAVAEKSQLENDRFLAENINTLLVKPLRKELNALRKDICKLQRAVECIQDCPHSESCPVKQQLQHNKECNDPDE